MTKNTTAQKIKSDNTVITAITETPKINKKPLKLYTCTATLKKNIISDLPLFITFQYYSDSYKTVWPNSRTACINSESVKLITVNPDKSETLSDFTLSPLYTIANIYYLDKKSKSPTITLDKLTELTESDSSLKPLLDLLLTKLTK